MRLTLRTLLAYLDDILEPNQAREIGRKVQESPMAQELVTRIRDVVRRRRLMAPTLDGPESGVDPNVVAEYLDNKLTPPQVAQTERILLNSEMHLAEVASAHQILTLVLGEPVEVLPESRKRMYALGPVADHERLVVESDGVAPPSIEPTDRLAAPSTNGLSAAATKSDAGVSLTDYVREERGGKRSWWPLVGVISLVGLFVALQWTDPGKSETSSPTLVTDVGSKAQPVPADPKSESAALPVPSDEGTQPAETTAKVDEPTAQPPAEPTVASTVPETNLAPEIDAEPPPDAAVAAIPPAPAETTSEVTQPPDTTSVPVAGMEPRTDEPDVTFVAPPVAGDTDPADPGMPAPPAVVEIPADIMKPAVVPPSAGERLVYSSTDGVLLRKTAAEGWKLVASGASIGDDDQVASPKPYVARFTVRKLPFQFELGAGSRMNTYNSANADVGVHLDTGHVVITRLTLGDAVTDKPGTIELKVADRLWLVTLPASESRIAFDASPVPPIRLDKLVDGFPVKVWAVGSLGKVTVQAADAEAKTVGSEDRIALAGPSPGAVLVEPGGASDWLIGKDPVSAWVAGPVAPTEKRDAIRFAKEFDPVDSIADSMPSLIRHERSWMARRAVQCLSLTGDYRALVRTLSLAEHDEATAEAILGLREWLPSEPENGAKLAAALEQEFTTEDSLAIYQLLWGYDEAHARDPKISRELVRWLTHDRPAVQRLAYFHILRLTGNQDDYRPMLQKDRMSSFRKRWERQIDKHGTLLND